jgi:mevalonate kinase
MFNKLINKKNEIIENNQRDISNMFVLFGGSDSGDSGDSGGNSNDVQNDIRDQYESFRNYSKSREIYHNLRQDLNNRVNQIKHMITGGSGSAGDTSFNISDVFLETEANEIETFKDLQKNMIEQQNIYIKTGGSGSGSTGGAKKSKRDLRADFQKKLREAKKLMDTLLKLHDKTTKKLDKQKPELGKHKKHAIAKRPVRNARDIRALLLADITRIAKMIK